jgi:hypothetical protein
LIPFIRFPSVEATFLSTGLFLIRRTPYVQMATVAVAPVRWWQTSKSWPPPHICSFYAQRSKALRHTNKSALLHSSNDRMANKSDRCSLRGVFAHLLRNIQAIAQFARKKRESQPIPLAI